MVKNDFLQHSAPHLSLTWMMLIMLCHVGDELVNISEWFGYAADAVPKLTKKYLGYEQDVHQQSEGVSFPVLPVSKQ